MKRSSAATGFGASVASLTHIADGLARHLLSGEWTRETLTDRVRDYLGTRGKRAQHFLVLYLLTHAPDYPPSHARLAWLLMQLDYLNRIVGGSRSKRSPVQPVADPPVFSPAKQYRGLDVPQIAAEGDLAGWLGLGVGQMLWLADTRRRHGEEAVPVMQNYTYTFLPKRSGGLRLVEAPKARLKAAQRQILRGILDIVPAHDACHGFVRGRSCLTGAALHAGEQIVLCMDVADFFPSTSAARVHVLFRRLGYPHAVTRVLTGLCTTMTPRTAFDRAPDPSAFDWEARKRYGAPHLPQGSPTSPALANLVARVLDARLGGLARKVSARYTRYADDLTFSGGPEFEEALRWFPEAVARVLRDEGWRANPAKTRTMRQSSAQVVTGIVVNQHLNVRREDYDALKAILFNCLRTGPLAQNRESEPDFRAHLDGRVAWVGGVNPLRGRKLRVLFDQVDWSA